MYESCVSPQFYASTAGYRVGGGPYHLGGAQESGIRTHIFLPHRSPRSVRLMIDPLLPQGQYLSIHCNQKNHSFQAYWVLYSLKNFEYILLNHVIHDNVSSLTILFESLGVIQAECFFLVLGVGVFLIGISTCPTISDDDLTMPGQKGSGGWATSQPFVSLVSMAGDCAIRDRHSC